jgi:hypothetical protein
MTFSKYAQRHIDADKALLKNADPNGDRFWVRRVADDASIAIMVDEGNAFALARQLAHERQGDHSVTRMSVAK